MRVPSGNDEPEIGRGELRMLDIVRGDMSLDMVNAYDRLSGGPCHGFGLRHPDEQSTHKSRPVRYSYCIDLIDRLSRVIKSFLHHVIDLVDVGTRCELRDYTAELGVHIDLGINHVG